MQSAELLVRRKLVEQSLLLMMTRNLVRREITPEGIKYSAGENVATFMAAMSSPYMRELKSRAEWLVNTLGSCTDVEFKTIVRRFFDQWVEEFQHVERSLGGGA